MYNVENRDTIWTVYKPNSWSRKLIVKHFKTEKELIRFLAFGYTETYVFDDPRLFLMDHIDCNNRFHHEYYDGYGRKNTMVNFGTLLFPESVNGKVDLTPLVQDINTFA